MTTRTSIACALTLALAAPAIAQSGAGCPGQELYAMGPTGRVWLVSNFTSGNPVGTLVGDTGIAQIADMAFDPVSGDMFMYALNGATAMDIYRVDTATWTPFLITTTSQMNRQNALDFSSDGTLYSHGPNTNQMWTINKVTGNGTVVGNTNSFTAGDVAVDIDGSVLLSTSTGLVQRFDNNTSQTTSLGNTGLGGIVYGIEVDCDAEIWILLINGELCTVERSSAAPTPRGNIGIPEDVWGMAFTKPADFTSLGTNYCVPALNSTGSAGRMAAMGSTTVADDDLTLLALSVPPGEFGYFIASQNQGLILNPGGSQGALCLSGTIARYKMFLGTIGSAGTFSAAVGTQAVPLNPNTPMVPGQTWNFQLWHRDLNPNPTSNFTDGLSIQFN